MFSWNCTMVAFSDFLHRVSGASETHPMPTSKKYGSNSVARRCVGKRSMKILPYEELWPGVSSFRFLDRALDANRRTPRVLCHEADTGLVLNKPRGRAARYPNK